MSGAVLGIDTSCYTTSAALAGGGRIIANKRRLLDVPQGGRGLRQSDGVFQHIGRLHSLIEEAVQEAGGARIAAVCASTRPRAVDGSYMPVFTVGEGYGRSIASAMGVPFFETSHQQGHLRAAMVDTDISDERFLALHLSGGTTEVLLREGDRLTLLGGTADLHAGQLVDRIGVALGLPFPAGPNLERLAGETAAQSLIPLSVDGLTCHFSGAEAQAKRMIESGECAPAQVAAEIYSILARTIARLIASAMSKTGAKQALLFGGVASSRLLRALLPARLARLEVDPAVCWARPELSGDNAAGVALIGEEMLGRDKQGSHYE